MLCCPTGETDNSIELHVTCDCETCIIYIINTCSNWDFRSLASTSKFLKICSSSASCKTNITAVRTDTDNIKGIKHEEGSLDV